MNEPAHSAHDGQESQAETHEIETIAQALDAWYSTLGRQFGPLSRAQRRMLRLLDTEQSVRVGNLAELLGLTTAGTTRMLDKLEASGYAVRLRDPYSDLRQVYVTLTAQGKAARDAADAAFLTQVQATLRVLDTHERATLATLLQRIQTRTSAQTPAIDDHIDHQ